MTFELVLILIVTAILAAHIVWTGFALLAPNKDVEHMRSELQEVREQIYKLAETGMKLSNLLAQTDIRKRESDRRRQQLAHTAIKHPDSIARLLKETTPVDIGFEVEPAMNALDCERENILEAVAAHLGISTWWREGSSLDEQGGKFGMLRRAVGAPLALPKWAVRFGREPREQAIERAKNIALDNRQYCDVCGSALDPVKAACDECGTMRKTAAEMRAGRTATGWIHGNMNR